MRTVPSLARTLRTGSVVVRTWPQRAGQREASRLVLLAATHGDGVKYTSLSSFAWLCAVCAILARAGRAVPHWKFPRGPTPSTTHGPVEHS
ncbi:hypothetical protein PsYK624_169900 [Phanerochaete sordida]|uniref:Uncharacterized protein n=1 Tax=Phanerochaete sordida TaxID=48140 RepID=A0A9P3LML6_9APHY|nr:hypothetical protein PsYK624_169900 [Phanerochaete sordida]